MSNKGSASSKKKLDSVVKLQIPAGKANPAPPVGTALGPKGINIMEFCKAFNDATKSEGDMVIPAVISIYKDRTFTFILRKPPVANLIKKELNIKSGSKEPGRVIVNKISAEQIRNIAKIKMEDLNCSSIEAAMLMVSGTARSMGIEEIL